MEEKDMAQIKELLVKLLGGKKPKWTREQRAEHCRRMVKARWEKYALEKTEKEASAKTLTADERIFTFPEIRTMGLYETRLIKTDDPRLGSYPRAYYDANRMGVKVATMRVREGMLLVKVG
jgi:hypothetical protein